MATRPTKHRLKLADEPSPEQEAFLLIQRTADVLLTDVAEMLKPYGISPTQYNVLRILRGAGAGCDAGGHVDPKAPGLPSRVIAERMITRDPDMTRLLDRLQHPGLVARGDRDPRDRRVISIRITAAGLELLRRLDQPVIDLHQRQLGHLGRRRLAELLETLEAVRGRCPNA